MLPKNKIPTYEIFLPVSEKTIKYRPWVSIESKKILTALMTKDNEQIENAILEVLQECTFNALDLTTVFFADIEYLYIKVKSKSKGEVIELTYQASLERDQVSEVIPIEFDLNTVTVSDSPERLIHLNTNPPLGIKMMFPTITLMKKLRSTTDEYVKIATLVEHVFDNSQVYDRSLFTEDELITWLQNLTQVQMEKILEFIKNIPTIKATLKFKLSNNKEKKIELSGLNDFFL